MCVGTALTAVPLQIKLTGLYLTVHPSSIGQIGHVAIEHEDRAFKSIAIFHQKERGVLAVFLHRSIGFVFYLSAGRLGQIE